MKKLFITLLLVSSSAFAKEYKGTATAGNESQALESAWTNAVIQMALAEHPETVDVTSYSRESLKGSEAERSMLINLDKLDLSSIKEISSSVVEKDGKFFATKIISGKARPKSGVKKPGQIEPYRYAQSLDKPQVYVGMPKAELLLKFGKPDRFYPYDQGFSFSFYNDIFCNLGVHLAACDVVINEAGVVVRFEGFKPEYTDVLK